MLVALTIPIYFANVLGLLNTPPHRDQVEDAFAYSTPLRTLEPQHPIFWCVFSVSPRGGLAAIVVEWLKLRKAVSVG